MDNLDFIRQYLNKMKHIQETILDFIDNEGNDAIFLQDFKEYLEQEKIQENVNDLKIVLRIISKISAYHYRTPNFFLKIGQILLILKESIQKILTNTEILFFFGESIPTLLFLIEEKILIVDEKLFNFIYSDDFEKDDIESDDIEYIYLLPKFMNFLNDSQIEKIKNRYPQILDTEKFNQWKFIGENDSYICQLIRNDSVEEFIAFINRNNIPLSSTIESSCYETNINFLINDVSLIEYAAYYGSIQIFQYLKFNNVDLKKSLWDFVIHSNKPEMIHLMEELQIEPEKDYVQYYIKAVQNHHNNIARYFKENFLNSEDIPNAQNLIHFNFSIFLDIFNNDLDILNNKDQLNGLLLDFCGSGCYEVVDFLLNNFDVDINSKIIFF